MAGLHTFLFSFCPYFLHTFFTLSLTVLKTQRGCSTCLETGYKKPVLLRLVLQIPSHITITVFKNSWKCQNMQCVNQKEAYDRSFILPKKPTVHGNMHSTTCALLNQLWYWLDLNYEKYFGFKLQPILTLFDNCTSVFLEIFTYMTSHFPCFLG